MGKKLNLQWVSNIVGDDYKNKWRKGDIVLIKAQTGTGKTFLVTGNSKVKGIIDYLEDYESLIYICNRTELKRQIKKSLCEKYGIEIKYTDDKNTIIDNVWLDGLTTFNNTVITSYHAIANGELDNLYVNGCHTVDFDYIVCDECHFFTTDSSYNNKALYSFNELVLPRFKDSIRIFISATMEELEDKIIQSFEMSKSNYFGTGSEGTIFKYNTGIDYSYLNVKYFKKVDDILQLIKNDTSEDKWLFFVSSTELGQNISKELNKVGVSSKFVKSGINSAEKKSIVSNSKFNCKVLVSTKCLDNGVNIMDDKVKNLIVMAYDKVTFIQEIGRKRIRIDNAENINLYIPTFSSNNFQKLLDYTYIPKFNSIDMFKEDIELFKRQYNNDLDKSYKDLFYLDDKNEWKLNPLGKYRLEKDIEFTEKIIDKFKKDKKFAYIKEQLSWLGLEGCFNELDLIEDVVDNEEVIKLEEYLENKINKRLYEKEQQEISDLIIKELITIGNKIDYRTQKLKPSTIESLLREELELPYAVSKPKREDKKIDGKRVTKSYIIISKIA